MILPIIIAILIIVADLVTKYIVSSNISLGQSVVAVKDVLNITYIQNEGMAFGLLSDKRYIFIIISTVMMIAIFVFLFIYRKNGNRFMKVGCAFILGGGIGNLIDRIRLGYVIDFIDVKCVPFWSWIFNIADMFVCIGVAFLAIYMLVDAVKTSRSGKKDDDTETESEITSEFAKNGRDRDPGFKDDDR